MVYIIVIIFICIVVYRYSIIKEPLEYDKTVCLVWRNLTDKSYAHGLGDKVRGAIAINQYCRNNKMNFIIDGTDDICGKFLKNIHSDKYEIIRTKNDIKRCFHGDMKDCYSIIDKYDFTKDDTMYIYTNECPKNDDCKTFNKDSISKEDKEFGKFICTPNDTFKNEIDTVIRSLPSGYGVQHFRFNDDVFNKDVSIEDSIFNEYYNILKNSYNPTDIILSNSNNFKQYANRMLGINVVKCEGVDCSIGHIGLSDSYEDIKPSFIEFYVIANARYIKTISVYPWVSNFVKWPALIYDVPLDVHLVKT